MYLRTILIALTSCLFANVSEAKVIEARHIEEILPTIDEETWILVDLDNCLFEAKHALGHANWFYDLIMERMKTGLTRQEAVNEVLPQWFRVQALTAVKPLEENTIPTLKSLQKRGLVVIGLTHREIPNIEATLHQVASLDFDFLESAPSKENLELDGPKPAYYQNGIIFVSTSNKKSDIFKKFIDKIKQKPSKIVFIDDQRRNVDDLEVLSQFGIEYTGIHYTAISHVPPLYNREIAEFQYKFLDKIMSNEAALLLMEQGIE